MGTDNSESNAPSLFQQVDATGEVMLVFKQCPACQSLVFPPGLPACAACGHALDEVDPQPLAHPCVLKEFVTVHVPLLANVPVPMVVGEIEVAPGIVRQGVIDAQESELAVGQLLRPSIRVDESDRVPRCVFLPAADMQKP